MTQRTYLTRVAGFLGTLSVLAAASNPANAYPANFAEAFLQGCRNSANANAERLGLTPEQIEDYCNCSLKAIQERYTFAELREQLGSVDLFSITCDCAKESDINSLIPQCNQ